MSPSRSLAVLAAGAALVLGGAGCGSSPGSAPSPEAGVRYEGALLPRTNPPISGRAMLAPTESLDGWVATVELQGRPSAGTALGWRIYSGICGTTGIPIGSPVDFPTIQLRTDGSGRATAVLDPGDLRGGTHSVRVFGTPSETGPVIACGELRREGD